MKYKSILILICLVILSCALCGCQKTPPKEEIGDKSAQSSIEAEEKSTNIIDCSLIDEVTDFSDGVAWVTDSKNGIEDKYLIDKNGVIQLALDKSTYVDISHYVNGKALAYASNGAYNYTNPTRVVAIVDKKGNTTWSLEVDAKKKAEALYGEDAVENVFALGLSDDKWGGYLIIGFDVDTFEYTGTLYGVIDANGNWIIEPPVLENAPEQITNKQYDNVDYGDYYLSIPNQAVLIYQDARVIPLPAEDTTKNSKERKNETSKIEQILQEVNAADHHERLYQGYGEFTDGSGKVVLDINSMPLYAPKDAYAAVDLESAFAYSEYCIVYLGNKGGGKYFTVIDVNGKQMFEPKKAGTLGVLGETAFYYQPDKDADGYYLTVNGGKLGSVTGLNGTRFCENRAWIKVDGVWRCIDESGEFAF